MIKNIVFMGTPSFAVPTLETLIKNNIIPVLIVSQPDKPKGRNQQLLPTPIKEVAQNNAIPCYQPEDVNLPESIEYIKSFEPDLIVTVAYGAFLGKELRTLCPFGAINMHPSLLPKHRGADPVRSTLLSNDELCGITVFFITAKMDSGSIIIQKQYAVEQGMNFTTLDGFLSQKGAEVIIEAIATISKSSKRFSELKSSFMMQNHEEATYSSKVDKLSTVANFDLSVNEFLTKVKAYSNEPGYYCYFRGKRLKLLKAELFEVGNNSEYPVIKQVIKNEGFVVSLKDGEMLVREVQYEGKNIMSAWDFHIGARIQIGERLCGEV